MQMNRRSLLAAGLAAGLIQRADGQTPPPVAAGSLPPGLPQPFETIDLWPAGAPGADQDTSNHIEWTRVLPFVLLHLSCAFVFVVGFSWFAVALFFAGISTKLSAPRQRATVLALGYVLFVVAYAGQVWPQSVNRHFEPGVRAEVTQDHGRSAEIEMGQQPGVQGGRVVQRCPEQGGVPLGHPRGQHFVDHVPVQIGM